MGGGFLRRSISDVVIRTHFTLVANVIGSVVGFLLVIACISYYWLQVKTCREREMMSTLAAASRSPKQSISDMTWMCNSPVIRLDPNARRAARRMGDYDQDVVLVPDDVEHKESGEVFRTSLPDPSLKLPSQMRRIPYLPPIREVSVSLDTELSMTHRSAEEYSVLSIVERPAAVSPSPSAFSLTTEQSEEMPKDSDGCGFEVPNRRQMALPLRLPVDPSFAAEPMSPVCVSARSVLSDNTLEDDFREIDLPDDSTVAITPRDWISLSGEEVDGTSIKLPEEQEGNESSVSVPL